MRLRRVVLAAWLASALNAWPIVAQAHDPSMYGGLFRTHDAGATWFPVVTDRYVSAVLAAAVSPTDSNHLLMGTTTGLYRSRNRGRDWVAEMRGMQASAAYAVTFDRYGQQALVSTGVALFRDDSNGNWTRISMPAGAAPARALVAGPLDGQVYLAGSSGLYRSDDFGGSWKQAGSGLPHSAVMALVVSRRPAQELYAVVAGRLWKGTDAGGTWRASDSGLPANAISAVLADPTSEESSGQPALTDYFAARTGATVGTWSANRSPFRVQACAASLSPAQSCCSAPAAGCTGQQTGRRTGNSSLATSPLTWRRHRSS
jgi:photosystem II stability/assembly factor-like uncharacterized protein